MKFNDLEQKTIDKALMTFMSKHRPPEHIRAQVDMGYRQTGYSVELFEIRPQWNEPTVIREHPFAKATFVKTQQAWKIFWRRANLKWHGYEPVPFAKTLAEFLKVVGDDEFACFFG